MGSRAVGKILLLVQGAEPGILYTLVLLLYRQRCRIFGTLYRVKWEGLSTKFGWLKGTRQSFDRQDLKLSQLASLLQVGLFKLQITSYNKTN